MLLEKLTSRAHLQCGEYCEESARLIFGDPRRTNKVARKIYDAIIKSPDGLDRTQVSSLLNRHKDQSIIDEAIKSLTEARMIYQKQEITGGRPKTIYFGISVPEL